MVRSARHSAANGRVPQHMQGSTSIACTHLHCRLQRMEEAASGGERRHIALLLRPLTEAIDMALTKHEAAKADALTSQP